MKDKDKRVIGETMTPFEEAYEIVMHSAQILSRESVPLFQSYDRILSQDIISDTDLPPFDKSAMDGYACRQCDINEPLRIIEIIPAGYKPQKIIRPGECSKIMTGAMVPKVADCVIMVEYTKEEKGLVKILKGSGAKNICYQGEDIRQGDVVLPAGTRVSPAEIAVLASVGCDPVPVVKRPVVGIIATGSELVEPSQKPGIGQIRNSNSYQLFAQLQRLGLKPHYYGIAKDTPECIDQALKRSLLEADIVLFSGGVSMGDFDYVPEILKQNGIEIKFAKVAVKPGKPTVFGMKKEKFFFGLPGNPVSTFVLFEMVVRPFLFKLMGTKDYRRRLVGKLKKTIHRKKTERLEFIPIHLTKEGLVEKIEYHGSAHIHAYTKDNGIISIPKGVKELKENTEIEVIMI